MTIEMKRDEFDGVIRINSTEPLELQSTVKVKNFKGEEVERFIVSSNGECDGIWRYNYAKDRQTWLDAEEEKREKRAERR